MKWYPHQFSGGMLQRSVMAIALAGNPEIVFADEPTTALDVTIQAQILDLFQKLQKKLGMAVVFVTHDLGVAAKIADRVAVMYAGKIVEIGTAEEIFYDARHPYTWGLLQSLPICAEAKGGCIQFQGRRLHHCPCQREMHLPAVINMPLGLTMKKSRRCFAFLIRIMRQHGFWRNVRQSCLACIGGQKDER